MHVRQKLVVLVYIGTFKKLMSALVDSCSDVVWGGDLGEHKRSEGNRTSTDACLPHVLWGGHLTPNGIIDDGVGIFTSSVGGKSEMSAV